MAGRDVTYSDLLAELAGELIEPEIPDNAVTVKMLMQATGRDEMSCRRALKRRVENGELERVEVRGTYYYHKRGDK